MSSSSFTRSALAASLALAWFASPALAADGTHTGHAKGIGGDVAVTIEVQNGRIQKIDVDTSKETPGYGRDIAATMAERIRTAGLSKVDGVSGATVTSDAVRAAAEDALRKAGLSAVTVSKTRSGKWQGTAHGAKSDLTVEIVVDEEGRVQIANVVTGDTHYVADTAVRDVTARIESQQSLAVDAVTGATLTSRALTTAVGRALEKAGADLSVWRQAKAPEVAAPLPDETYDVVVVGGGAAGMMAAYSAKADDNGQPNNLRVALVETKGYVGGDLAICGGYIAAYAGTVLNERTGVSLDGKTVAAASKAMRTPEAAAMLNDDLAARVVDETGPTVARLMAAGVPIRAEDATRGEILTPYFESGRMHYTVARTLDPETNMRSMDFGYDDTTGSPYVVEAMVKMLEKAGVDIKTETTVTNVDLESGRATGVKVSHRGAPQTLHAKAVVLATGYSGLDPESVEKFYPNLAGVTRTGGAGVTSFAPKWMLSQGGQIALNPASSTMLGYDSVIGLDGPESAIYRDYALPWVNVHGERFMSEGGHPPISRLNPNVKEPTPAIEVITPTGRSVADLLKQDGKAAWMIFDNKHPAAKVLDRLTASGLAHTADTLEDLAKAAGLDDPQRFVRTIERYNADYRAGRDTVFGTDKADMTPVLEGPFHAVRITAVNTICNVSVYADDDLTILTGPDGKRIEGLYGAGGAIGNAITNAGLGAHNATALSSGVLAGREARDKILK